jgi:hypothetical protein
MALIAGVVSLLCSAPASALLNQGHVFAGTFEGSGAQGFGTPGGLAVDEATGEVLVADSAHGRVERFEPKAGRYEFVGEIAVPDPGVVAVDNSSSGSDPSRGDVYVASASTGEERADGERGFLYKFTGAGEKIFKKKLFKAKEGGEEFEAELERISGLAVDATGGLWVYWYERGNITGLSDEETNKLIPSRTKEEVLEQPLLEDGCLTEPGFAVGPGEEVFYVAHERETGLEDCLEEAEPQSTMVSQLAGSGIATERSLDNQDTTGVALDPADGDVYVDNVTSVAAFDGEGSFIQRFGSGQLSDGGAVAVDSAHGIVYAAEPGKVAVFAREGAGAPMIDGVSAQNLTPSSERVDTKIDPDGASTSYYVEYGTSGCVEDGVGCGFAPVAPPGEGIGKGFGDVSVHVTLEGLAANTTYYYWVVTKNEHGTVESPRSVQTFFTTLPSSKGVLLDDRQWQLVSPADMHGATPELISPPFLGSLIQASTDGGMLTWTASAPISGEAQGNRQPEPVQVLSRSGSEEWSSEGISTAHNVGEGVSTEEPTEYRFFSPDLSLAVLEPQILREPLEDPPLAPGAKEKTIYTRENGAFEPLVAADETGKAFGGKLEFQGATVEPSGGGGGQDLHVVFGSQVGLVSGAGENGLYEWEEGQPLKLVSVLPGSGGVSASSPRLGFERGDVRGAISQNGTRVFWTNEEELGPLYMRDTSREETVQVNAAQGVPEAGAEEREDGLDEVYFQAASRDGSRVFFTDTWPLTGESTLEPYEEEGSPRRADLYEYDVETGTLSDLTVDRNAGEQAEVLGTLPGASEDGAYAYFVANGALASGPERGDCPRANPFRNPGASNEGECNLYVSEPDPAHPGQRQTRFIARLSEQDAADWGEGDSPVMGDLGGVSSQVSSNGRYLAFMSDRELTGYDNVDAAAGANGAHDEEVFVYDASTGRLVCASCNPTGQPPDGVFDTKGAGEGEGLAVDRPETWSEHWLAGSIPGWTLYGYDPPMTEHQSRYLTNQGRLFFNSADPLVAQDEQPTRTETVNGQAVTVGVENVYEYEPPGLGSCEQASGCVALVSSGTSAHESAFLDASENGDDVFFLTQAKLVAQDTEPSGEVYDSAVCDTSETQPCLPLKTPPKEPCTGEACRAPAAPPLNFQAPPTSSTTPPPRPPPPPPPQPAPHPNPNHRRPNHSRAHKSSPTPSRPATRTSTSANAKPANAKPAKPTRPRPRTAAPSTPAPSTPVRTAAPSMRTPRRTGGAEVDGSTNVRATSTQRGPEFTSSSSAAPAAEPGSARAVRVLLVRIALCVLGSSLLLAVCASPALAGGAWWRLSSRAAPSSLPPGGKATIVVSATNVGDGGIDAMTAPVTIRDVLPAGLEPIKISGKPALREAVAHQMTCDLATVSCSSQPEVFPAFERLEMGIEVNVRPGASTGEQNTVEVHGGQQEGSGAEVSSASLSTSLSVSGQPTLFGVEEDGYTLAPEEEGGGLDRQAGSHPFQLTTALNLNQSSELISAEQGATETGLIGTAPALPKRLSFNLPPGLIGDPRAVPACPGSQFTTIGRDDINSCAPDTAIGVAVVSVNLLDPAFHNITRSVPLWNLVPAQGEPARFGFEVLHVPVVLDTSLRSSGDYGVSVNVTQAPESAQLLSSEVTIWGAPAQAAHDQSRGWGCLVEGAAVEHVVPCELTREHSNGAFLTMPTSCSKEPLRTTVEGESWPVKLLASEPGEAFPLGGDTQDELPGFEGCDRLSFTPSITMESTEHAASTPTGMTVNVSVPQQGTVEAGELAQPALKSTTVTLPEGVQLNPAAAGGLEACSEQQIGYEGPSGTDPLSPEAPQPLRFSTAPADCPNASKVGTVHIRTPLLEEELTGAVYLATPAPLAEAGQNPFNSLLALYIVAEDPRAGILVKLAGKTQLDPQTGRVTSSFTDTPQVPFEELRLELFGGPRASLATSSTCGNPPIQASFLPWSAEPGHEDEWIKATLGTRPEEQLQISTGGEGGSCPSSPPFAPSLQGGATNTNAGAFTEFALAITRPGADQQLTGATVHLPLGNAAILASVTPCPEPQASNGTCGPESQIGEARASSGLGPDPYTVSGGRVYVTGPYEGAPFGLSIVTPAVAGPFNLGNVVVRAKIEVNPHTAQVTITSGLPTYVQGVGRPPSGVPLQIREIEVNVNRPNFEFNPTNCGPHAIEATLNGAQGASQNVSWPFQVTNCQNLPFTPKVEASAQGQTSKLGGASLKLKFTSGNNQAHVAKTVLTIPAIMPARLSTIQKACVASVLETNPAACPEGSDIGTAVVHTQVLKNPLAGPIYLVSHGNAAWPDAELVLQGENQIKVILDGQTAIKKGITTSSFLAVPDVPFETVEANLPEGPHSALTTNLPANHHYSLCGQNLTIPTTLTAQNGNLAEQTAKVKIEDCAPVKPVKVKKPTRAQKLANALKACRKRYKHASTKRTTCEQQARKRYSSEGKSKTRAPKT